MDFDRIPAVLTENNFGLDWNRREKTLNEYLVLFNTKYGASWRFYHNLLSDYLSWIQNGQSIETPIQGQVLQILAKKLQKFDWWSNWNDITAYATTI